MNWQLVNIFIGILSFSLFMILQAIVINGVYECFQGKEWVDLNKGAVWSGNIFYPIARFLKTHIKNQTVLRPVFLCVKCMASFWGAATFWPAVILLFGFNWIEVLVFIFDCFALVYLNYYFFKKV